MDKDNLSPILANFFDSKNKAAKCDRCGCKNDINCDCHKVYLCFQCSSTVNGIKICALCETAHICQVCSLDLSHIKNDRYHPLMGIYNCSFKCFFRDLVNIYTENSEVDALERIKEGMDVEKIDPNYHEDLDYLVEYLLRHKCAKFELLMDFLAKEQLAVVFQTQNY